MLKKIFNNQIIIFSILGIITAGLIIFANLVIGKIYENSNIIGEEISKLNKRNLSTENLRDSLALVKEVGQNSEEYERYFFNQGEELGLITDLESIALKNFLYQKIINSNLDNYTNNQIDISINISGSYLNILNYLTDLESYRHIISIQKIEFQPESSSAVNPEQLPANMRLQISLYVNPKKI